MHKVKSSARKEIQPSRSYIPFIRFNTPRFRRRPLPASPQNTVEALNHFDAAELGNANIIVQQPNINVDLDTKGNETDTKPERQQQFTIWSDFRYAFFNSWANCLLVFVPIGFAVRYSGQSPVVVFAMNFLASLPLALVLGFASDELLMRTGDLWGALVNCTFSNAVQLITSILLLKEGQVALLQISLVGSILSNMHLAVGLGFFLGGINRKKQYYNPHMAQVLGTGLLLSVAALIIPTILKQLQADSVNEAHLLSISRSIAIILLLCYGIFLFYSLRTHKDQFEASSEKTVKENLFKNSDAKPKGTASGILLVQGKSGPAPKHLQDESKAPRAKEEDNDGDEGKEPSMRLLTSLITIIITTTLLGFSTAFATDSLDGLIESSGLTNTFIGIVLLPLLSVDFTMFPLAMKDKMDLFLSVTVGKCFQTTLLVIPVIILLGWILDVPVGLDLDIFEAIALYASVVYINNMIQAGESTYFQGVLLLGLFIIICIVSFYLNVELDLNTAPFDVTNLKL